MYTCPACGQRTMSALRTFSLGPARSVPCRECGVPVSVPAAPAAAA